MTPQANIIWEKVSRILEQKLNSDVFARWIAVIAPGQIAGNSLSLQVSNNFYQSWLEENYLPLIKEAVNAVCGQKMQVIFEVSPDNKPAAASAAARPDQAGAPANAGKAPAVAKRAPAKKNAGDNFLNPKYVFASFIIGPSNSFAHASSLAVAQAPGKAYNPLFIYGGVGLGKTHLMQAIGHYVTETAKLRASYVSCETMMNEYVEAVLKKNFAPFRNKYRGTDVLLIDDIHFLTKTERLQEEFFHTFNVLYDAHKQIVMTSDRPAGEISGLEQRLVSRFEWGLVTELTQPDFETRIAILRSKQQTMNVILAEDVINFIASCIKSNIRRLEGALIRLVSYASLYNKPINVALAEQLLQDSIEQETRPPLSIAAIQKGTAAFFDLRLADMTSINRAQNIALPRQVAMYLCRKLTNASLPEIGTAFGKTHATVLYAYRQIERKVQRDKQLKQALLKLSKSMDKNINNYAEKL